MNKFNIAVIGSGPAGMTIVKELCKHSEDAYRITVFEKHYEPGGLLVCGIPEFRIKKTSIRKNVADLKEKGVVFHCNTTVGVDISIQDIIKEYDVVFLGIGTIQPMSVPQIDEHVSGVFQTQDFLSHVQHLINTGKEITQSYIKPEDHVLVIGGGDVALDGARVALRCGARVSIVYRRDLEHMPCTMSEYRAAVKEGIDFKFCYAPQSLIGEHSVEGLVCEKQDVIDGIMYPTGQTQIFNGNKILLAIGYKPSEEIIKYIPGLELSSKDYINTKDIPYGSTNIPGIFAAGDIVHGPATVSLAIKEAKKVAQGIIEYLEKE